MHVPAPTRKTVSRRRQVNNTDTNAARIRQDDRVRRVCFDTGCVQEESRIFGGSAVLGKRLRSPESGQVLPAPELVGADMPDDMRSEHRIIQVHPVPGVARGVHKELCLRDGGIPRNQSGTEPTDQRGVQLEASGRLHRSDDSCDREESQGAGLHSRRPAEHKFKSQTVQQRWEDRTDAGRVP